MLDCRNLNFSPELAESRMASAQAVFGEAMLRRFLAFALFILGAPRSRIAAALNIPPGTIRSLVRRVLHVGLDGLIDQRCATVSQTQREPPEPARALTVCMPDLDQTFRVDGGQMVLTQQNPVQRKVVLLSLIGKDLLSVEEVAKALGLSQSHVRRLHRQLLSGDVDAVIDKRRGQQLDYRVDVGVKGRMIAEFVLELAECGRVSSAAVARRLADQGDKVAERTIRHHLSSMGLHEVRGTLVTALSRVKKTSEN